MPIFLLLRTHLSLSFSLTLKQRKVQEVWEKQQIPGCVHYLWHETEPNVAWEA